MGRQQEFRVRVGDREHRVIVEVDGEGASRVSVDGEPYEVIDLGAGSTAVRAGATHAQHRVTLDPAPVPEQAAVDGRVLELAVRTAQQATLEDALTAGGSAAESGAVVKAPMPGRVVRVHVAAGDIVVVGDALLVVEAMKMENELLAATDGRVSLVSVSDGDTVDAGQVLCEIGPHPDTT